MYVDHIRRGVALAAADSEALLVFAGGQTDRSAGPRSEGQGYWLAADSREWFGHDSVRERATTEEFSLDSFQNVLFGLCRFGEFTGEFPGRLTVVGWRFKAARFDLHREAIRFPRPRFHYEGVNDPADLAGCTIFEDACQKTFCADPYGSGVEIAAKRGARNPFHRQHGYRASCPALAAMLGHEGPARYSGPLPWPAP